ncbi:MAG: glucosamine-6-phosphate deaminase, partial [Bryobacteraceae bacterium]
MTVEIFSHTQSLGAAAAAKAASLIRAAVQVRGEARVVVATGNSHLQFIGSLAETAGIDWGA